jgi:hypothetical protein
MAQTTQEPLGKAEQMLVDMIDGKPIVEAPENRIEGLLMELAEAIEQGGGGGGGGATNYNALSNKPKVNNVELSGNKTLTQLGIQPSEAGKGLSSNDYTTEEKTKLAGLSNYDDTALTERVTANETAISGKVDKETGKSLSTNDYTNADKAIVDGVTTALAGKADVDDVIDGASYDSTNHLILFKNGTTTLFSLDAAAFVKDGMVDTVTITGGNLVITFNTDAGKQAISIPITDIFDPTNYYDKDDVDGLLADKADKTDVDSAIVGQQSLLKDTVGWTGKNLFNVNTVKELPTGVVLNKTDTGIQVRNTVAATWRFASFWITHLPKNTDYIISCNVLITSGKGKILVKDFETQTSIFDVNVEDGEAFTRKFNTGNYNSLYFTMYCATNTAELGDVTYNNLMIRKADIEDSTYEPYHESVEVMYEEEIHGVNLLKNTAVNKTDGNVAWVVNADKSVTINTSESASSVQTLYIGEVTGLQGDYILNGVTGGSLSTYGIQLYDVSTSTWITQYAIDGDSTINLADKNHTYRFVAYVRQGVSVSNKTIYPMLRKANIEDPTYHPYNEQAIQNQLNAQGVLGAKNLLPQVEHANTTMTINGVTITSREDGSVLLNGTSTAPVAYHFIRLSSDANRKFIKKVVGKKVTISGTNVLNTGAKVQFWSSVTDVIADTTGKGTTFTMPSDLATTGDYNFAIYIPSGVTVNDIIVYPMLRLASDPDDTYLPYTMTNRELMEKVVDTDTIEVSSFLDSTYVSSCGSFRYRVKNGICFVYINNIKFTTDAIDVVDFVILPEGVLPKGLIPASSMLWNKATQPLLLGLIRNNAGDIKVTVNGINSSNVNSSWYAASFSYPIV